MNFPYMYQTTADDSIDIENIGEVCLNAFNDEGREYYLSIHCSLGWVVIEEFGPLVADQDEIPSGFFYTYSSVEYNEGRLKKRITDFLNNPKRFITQVFEIDYDKFSDRLNGIRKPKE